MYPAERGCIALVAPLAQHPVNKNELIVYDLGVDPQPFLALNSDILRERLFTPKDELPEGCERLPIKTIHINKSPVVVPVSTLTPEAADKWQLDLQLAQKHLELLLEHSQFSQNLRNVYVDREFAAIDDPDFMIYSGGFFSNDDKSRMETIRETTPDKLAEIDLPFQDKRLTDMLFRYRARNYPDSLTNEERTRWDGFRRQRLTVSSEGVGLTVDECLARISDCRQEQSLSDSQHTVLDALESYAIGLKSELI